MSCQSNIQKPHGFQKAIRAMLFMTIILSLQNLHANPYPFEISNDFILCEATIEGKTVTLLLDSGAPGLVLNETYFAEDDAYDQAMCTGINGPFVCQLRKITDWDWLGIRFNKTVAILSDLSFLERVTGRKIHGLAGLSLLKRYYVTVNLDRHTIQVDREMDDLSAFSAFQYAAHVPVMMCTVNGKVKRLGLDTGAETNYLFNYPHRQHPSKTATPIRVTGTENRTEQRQIMELDVTFVESATPEVLPFVVDASDNSFLAEYPIDGLLGQAFLSQYNFTIHPGKQQIRLERRNP